jgi:dienelactone hydrolase
MEGYLAEPKSISGKVPGILLIHEWTGLGEYVKGRSDQFAELGYVAFAMDMYGKGVRVEDHDHDKAGKIMGEYMANKPLMISRISKAIEILKSNPNVDPNKIAIVGYCFGGAAALEYGFSGQDINAIVSFHGMLFNPPVKEAKKTKAKLAIHHGGDDKFIPAATVTGLQKTLKDAGVKFEFHSYPGAVHGFTRASAGTAHKAMGIAYDEKADKESWEKTKTFLKASL